jgi:predicted nuclease of predicted toxin-antitoxin system
VRDLGLRDANDAEIFQAARQSGAIVMTKDRDFVVLLDLLSLTPDFMGNVWQYFQRTPHKDLGASLPQALQLLEQGEPLIEITDQYNGVLSV